MATSDDHQTARRPANRSIYADLLAKVRDLKINLTATLEQALVERLRQRQRAMAGGEPGRLRRF